MHRLQSKQSPFAPRGTFFFRPNIAGLICSLAVALALVALPPARAQEAAAAKTVAAQGDSGTCWFSRETAMGFAQTGVNNDARNECYALGPGWILGKQTFSGYSQCAACGTSNEFKCNIKQAVFTCRNLQSESQERALKAKREREPVASAKAGGTAAKAAANNAPSDALAGAMAKLERTVAKSPDGTSQRMPGAAATQSQETRAPAPATKPNDGAVAATPPAPGGQSSTASAAPPVANVVTATANESEYVQCPSSGEMGNLGKKQQESRIVDLAFATRVSSTDGPTTIIVVRGYQNSSFIFANLLRVPQYGKGAVPLFSGPIFASPESIKSALDKEGVVRRSLADFPSDFKELPAQFRIVHWLDDFRHLHRVGLPDVPFIVDYRNAGSSYNSFGMVVEKGIRLKTFADLERPVISSDQKWVLGIRNERLAVYGKSRQSRDGMRCD